MEGLICDTWMPSPHFHVASNLLIIPRSVSMVDFDMPSRAIWNFYNNWARVVFSDSASTFSKRSIHSFNLRSASFLSEVTSECSLRLPRNFLIP
jgi:hypothetical protein